MRPQIFIRVFMIFQAILMASGTKCFGADRRSPARKAISCGNFREGETVQMKGLSKALTKRGLMLGAVSFTQSEHIVDWDKLDQVNVEHVLKFQFMNLDHSHLGTAFLEHGKIKKIVCEDPMQGTEDGMSRIDD